MNIVYRIIYPILGLIIILLIGFIAFTLINENNKEEAPDEQEESQTSQDTLARKYTAEEVAASNTSTDCLMIYNGKVYDIPESYMNEHPAGAQAILKYCGKDATEIFSKVHKQGTVALDLLNTYIVGEIESTDGKVKGYTREDVTVANTIDNCLLIIEDSVYSIPSTFADEHPGGSSEITGSCGKDITEDFRGQDDHTSEDATKMLEQFYAGVLN